jgi:hypothetical protein
MARRFAFEERMTAAGVDSRHAAGCRNVDAAIEVERL